MQKIDPIRLQRLIDGELVDAELRELIEIAESEPGGWRQVAIGFIEDRQWQSGFQKQELDQTEPSGNELSPPIKVGDSQPKGSSLFSKPSFGWKWFGLAAIVFLSLTIGFMFSEYWGSTPGGQHARSTGTVPVQLARETGGSQEDLVANTNPALGGSGETGQPPETLVSYRPDYHLELHDAYGKPVLDGQIPLYTYANAKKIGYTLESPEMPQAMRDRFSDSGYLLNENVKYISGSLDDGRQFVLPVRTISFSPGQ